MVVFVCKGKVTRLGSWGRGFETAKFSASFGLVGVGAGLRMSVVPCRFEGQEVVGVSKMAWMEVVRGVDHGSWSVVVGWY